MLRTLLRLFSTLIFAAVVAGAAAAWWLHQPLPLRAPVLDLSIELGTSPRGVAQAVADAGVDVNPTWLLWWFKAAGTARQIKAGSYEIVSGETPRSLLLKLTRGEETLRSLVLVEGWNFRQVREALQREAFIRHDTQTLSNDDIMARLGHPGIPAEGRFFPDTYTYAKGSSDLDVLRRALKAMDSKLAAAWNLRAPGVALTSPEQVLTLASIVEKETGRASDRAMIASVFHNRLRVGMLLQTDPTVIYGLGTKFDGNLRKRDLQTDTPWNTYTRAGLPPTPIAMPGKAALLAAVQPADSKALYFVARGDGSSQFSDDLDAHNKAVNRFIRGKMGGN
jgi:UPF0755 protein